MIVAFVIQILFALKFLKRNSILHRDLKPSNILISEKGLFKVVDFGISKKLIESNLAVSCLGTPYYTAPEILAEE
jgi:serine/threonine protein kinase